MISGPIMTALEMAGISISILALSDDICESVVKCIDTEVSCPGWPKVNNSVIGELNTLKASVAVDGEFKCHAIHYWKHDDFTHTNALNWT